MLKIGDFSRLGRVTIKTLHHYEQVGLLRPYWIDRFTGYRYYSLEQLPRLNRILALKDLGFSLSEIGALVNDALDAGALRQMLAEKEAELEQRVRAEQRRLEMVAVRLRQIELEGSTLPPAVLVKSAPAEQVASLRARVPAVEQVPACSARLYRQVSAWLAAQALPPTPDWFTLHDNPEYQERQIEIETAAVISAPPRKLPEPLPGPVTVRSLPAVPEMASLFAPAQPAELAQAYASLYGWVEANGYLVSSPVREVYLRDEGDSPQQMVELQFPIERSPYWSTHVRTNKKESEMDVKIVNQPALRLVGLRYQGKNQNNEIAQMWNVFNRRAGEIQHLADGPAYGVCRMIPGNAEGEFEYVACLPVEQVESLPEGMVQVDLPELKCAAYPHHGSLEKLGESYEGLYKGWLPQSGQQALEPGFDMEVYGKEFDPRTGAGMFYIYLPLK